MQIEGKVVLVTGGAHGIGKALAERCHREGAAGVAVADLDGSAAEAVAASIDGLAIRTDVSVERDIQQAVAATEQRFGPIDLLCSNAGVAYSDAPGWMATSQLDHQWEKAWKINVMAHVWGARAVLPQMIDRGAGYLLNTVSAAGLLNQIGDAAYSTTKHAALGFAESLTITHGDQGIGVSVLCPQAVQTAMFEVGDNPDMRPLAEAASADGVLSPADVAAAAVAGLAENRFLILPHPRVATYFERKALDYERWLGGMRKFRRSLQGEESAGSF